MHQSHADGDQKPHWLVVQNAYSVETSRSASLHTARCSCLPGMADPHSGGGAPSTMRKAGDGPRSTRPWEQHASLGGSHPFRAPAHWPSSRTPTTSNDIEACGRADLPRCNQISRTIGRRASGVGPQSAFTSHPVTVSLPTAPPNSAASARRTRRSTTPRRYRRTLQYRPRRFHYQTLVHQLRRSLTPSM
jgi:hypothetical protein